MRVSKILLSFFMAVILLLNTMPTVSVHATSNLVLKKNETEVGTFSDLESAFQAINTDASFVDGQSYELDVQQNYSDVSNGIPILNKNVTVTLTTKNASKIQSGKERTLLDLQNGNLIIRDLILDGVDQGSGITLSGSNASSIDLQGSTSFQHFKSSALLVSGSHKTIKGSFFQRGGFFSNKAMYGAGLLITGDENTVDLKATGLAFMSENKATEFGAFLYVSGNNNQLDLTADTGGSMYVSSNSAQGGGAIMLVGQQNKLTISTKGGKIDFQQNQATAYSGGAISVQGKNNSLVINANDGTMNFIQNKALKQKYGGGAIYAQTTGTKVDINATNSETNQLNFTYNMGSPGGAIGLTEGAKLTLNGGNVTSFVQNATLTYESEHDYGGAIAVSLLTGGQIGSHAQISNTKFKNNYAADGGAIMVGGHEDWPSTLDINTCSFGENIASTIGGGIEFSKYGKGTVSQCDFTSNKGTQGGGGIAIDSFGTATIKQSNFKENKGLFGGGIYAAGDLTVDHVTMEKNTSIPTELGFTAEGIPGYGGGISFFGKSSNDQQSKSLTVKNSTFLNNQSKTFGGGILITGGKIEIDQSEFRSN